MAAALPRPLSLRDYLRLAEESGHELIGGALLVTPAPTLAHQLVRDRILMLLARAAERHAPGTVVGSPFDVVLSPHDIVQPDVVYIAREHRDRMRERLHGPPDIAVEVLSPGNAERDRNLKRRLYDRHGVAEYWIVDLQARTVAILRRGDGALREVGVRGIGSTLTSPRLGRARIPVRRIFEVLSPARAGRGLAKRRR